MEGTLHGSVTEVSPNSSDSNGRGKTRKSFGEVAIKSRATETQPRRQAAEAQQLHGEKQPEHIGHVLMTAEAEPGSGEQKHLATINRPELLELSDTIEVDGTTLRQIYETHLIGERGLRRLIAEYLHGGDLKKALRQEIIEREIDFERDPGLRDMGKINNSHALTTSAAPADAASQTALHQLLERAEASIPSANLSEEAAFYKAHAKYEAKQHEELRRQRKLIDMALVASAAILIIAAIIVFLVRR